MNRWPVIGASEVGWCVGRWGPGVGLWVLGDGRWVLGAGCWAGGALTPLPPLPAIHLGEGRRIGSLSFRLFGRAEVRIAAWAPGKSFLACVLGSYSVQEFVDGEQGDIERGDGDCGRNCGLGLA